MEWVASTLIGHTFNALSHIHELHILITIVSHGLSMCVNVILSRTVRVDFEEWAYGHMNAMRNIYEMSFELCARTKFGLLNLFDKVYRWSETIIRVNRVRAEDIINMHHHHKWVLKLKRVCWPLLCGGWSEWASRKQCGMLFTRGISFYIF